MREYKYDNIRFVLIALVVLGHLIEISNGIPHRLLLYKFIYTFHMPAFIFLSGLMSSFHRERIVFKLLVPYIVMQCAYTLFLNWLTDSNTEISFTTPYWILWYILALTVYTCLIPVYSTGSARGAFSILSFSIVLALLAGYDNSIGYYLSLSRIIVFQPFFLLGFYCRKFHWLDKVRQLADLPFSVSMLSACAVFMIFWLYLYQSGVPDPVFSGSQPYSALGYGLRVRAAITAAAFSAIFLLMGVSEKYLDLKIPIMTTLGQNTLGIFLFHGFVVQLLHYKPFVSVDSVLSLILLDFGILLVFGNPVFNKLVDLVLCGGWLRKTRSLEKLRMS